MWVAFVWITSKVCRFKCRLVLSAAACAWSCTGSCAGTLSCMIPFSGCCRKYSFLICCSQIWPRDQIAFLRPCKALLQASWKGTVARTNRQSLSSRSTNVSKRVWYFTNSWIQRQRRCAVRKQAIWGGTREKRQDGSREVGCCKRMKFVRRLEAVIARSRGVINYWV